jgi:RNA polymerase sigma-70 factor (ECF subfamily)
VRDPSEDELDGWMARLAAGDRAAFDPLFRELYPRALRLARQKLAADQSADAAQQILMKLFARASEFEAGKPVLPWFYASAANEIHSLSRRAARKARDADFSGVEEQATTGANPEQDLVDCELRQSIDLALASLDDESAVAIRALLGDGPRPEVAPATFRKRVSRAYARLRLMLGAADGK